MKRLRYQDLKGDDLIVSAHTGLNRIEFETLAKEFNQVVETYFIHFTIEGKIRQRQYKSRKNSVFVEWSDYSIPLKNKRGHINCTFVVANKQNDNDCKPQRRN